MGPQWVCCGNSRVGMTWLLRRRSTDERVCYCVVGFDGDWYASN